MLFLAPISLSRNLKKNAVSYKACAVPVRNKMLKNIQAPVGPVGLNKMYNPIKRNAKMNVPITLTR
jgi:hypothetical protein